MDGEDFRILSNLSSDTGVKEDSVFLVELGLVTEDGVDDCSVDLILRILSEKNLLRITLNSKKNSMLRILRIKSYSQNNS